MVVQTTMAKPHPSFHIDEGCNRQFWVLDCGTPGTKGDDLTTLTWTPGFNQPDCDYEVPGFRPFVVDGGNLVIHE
jgi:hypothetical protein